MASLRDEATGHLDQLSSASGVRGALIATRDGLLANGSLKKGGDSDTVAAMAAASLAALEAAGMDVGTGSLSSVQAHGGEADLHIAELDDQYLLVVIADAGSDTRATIEKARNELRKVLKE